MNRRQRKAKYTRRVEHNRDVRERNAAKPAPVTPDFWAHVTATAKRQRKGIAKVAERMGLTLIGDNPRERTSWTWSPTA